MSYKIFGYIKSVYIYENNTHIQVCIYLYKHTETYTKVMSCVDLNDTHVHAYTLTYKNTSESGEIGITLMDYVNVNILVVIFTMVFIKMLPLGETS